LSAAVRVLIADDHPPTRVGVRAALEEGGFEVCAEARDAPSAVKAALRERPEVCLLDICMPGGGITAAARIAAQLPETAVVMLTISVSDEDLFDALRAGASGYLLKDIDAEELPRALRRVLDGEAALPGILVARVVQEFRAREQRKRIPLLRERGVKLTNREWEVLELMKPRFSTAEIAERLSVSPTTVRRHVSSILKKLRVPDRKSALRVLEES
jgi:DNA-binding NarL/FixJ family response regulator